MAAASISSIIWPTVGPGGRFGPFQDSNGDLWVVGVSSAGELRSVISTDAGATWETYYGLTGVTRNPTDCVFNSKNDVIYVTCVQGTTIYIYSFTISTTTWAEIYSSGTRPTVALDVNNKSPVFLTRRSSGEFVVFYQGPTHSNMGSAYRSVYYARCSAAGVWSSGVEVDAGGATNYDCKSACRGELNRTHMFFASALSGAPATHRSLSSANALDTAGSVGGYTNANIDYYTAYYDAFLGKIIWGMPSLGYIYRATSGAGPTWTLDTNTPTNLTEPNVCGPNFIYDPSSAKLYCFYRDATSDDVYQNSAAATTWGTPVQQDACAAVTGISVGLLGDVGSIVNFEEDDTDGIQYIGATSSNQKIAQSFSFSRDTDLTSIVLTLQRTGTPTDNVVIEIQSDSAGSPSGSVIASIGTLAASSISLLGATYPVSCNVSLSANTTYWLVLSRSGAVNGSNYISQSWMSSGSAHGGSVKIWDGNSWGSSNTADYRISFFTSKGIGVLFNDSGVYFDKLVLVPPEEPIEPTTTNEEFFALL